MRTAVLPLAVGAAGALTLFLLVSCGSKQGAANRPGSIAVADKGRAADLSDAGFDDRGRCEYRGHEDREVSETAGPGSILPNVRRVYQVIGTGDDRRKVLVCREVDTNLDGYKDVIRTYNDKGESLHEEADANYDGKMDTWVTFNNGRIQKEELDLTGDGQPDEWKYYSAGVLSRIQRDTNHDGKPDVWEFYQRGRLERMGVDVDFDGHVDRWDHDEIARRATDAEERAQEKSPGAAKANDADAGAASLPGDAGAGSSVSDQGGALGNTGATDAGGATDGGGPSSKTKGAGKRR